MDSLPFLVVVLLMVAVVRCLDKGIDDQWEMFKTTNNRTYRNPRVESKRRYIWEKKIREIKHHNIDADHGVHSYWMRETEWDDLTFKEFLYPEGYFDFNFTPLPPQVRNCSAHELIRNDKQPLSKDWTEEGFVTSVKNQKPGLTSCGACWAFAAVGAVEGQLFKKTKTLVNLSVQSLVDCSVHNYGCFGGWADEAIRDFIDLSGIPTEESYPYEAKNGTCKLSLAKIGAIIEDCRKIKTDEELLNSVAFIGPVSVIIQTGPKFQNLGKGIYTDCTGPENHIVLAVGYGVHKGKQVWKIKNSHGSSWGDGGYFYLPRYKVNACSISSYGSYPIVAASVLGEDSLLTNGAVMTNTRPYIAFTLLLSLVSLEAIIR